MKGSKLLIASTTIATCFCSYYINKTNYDNKKIELQYIYGHERQMDQRAYGLIKVKVVDVIEGDIIEIENKGIRQRVRLLGLDCPNIDKKGNSPLSLFKDEDYYLSNEELLQKYNLKEEDIPLDLKTTNLAAYIKEQILNETYNPPKDVLENSNKDEFNLNSSEQDELLYNSSLTNEEKELLKLFYKLKSGNMAEEAKEYTTKLLLNKEIYLMNDIQTQHIDSLGRELKYAFINEPSLEQNEEELKKNCINYKLIEEGYAKATNFGGPKQYVKELKNAEKNAKSNNNGIWDIENYYNNINTSILQKEGKKSKEIKDILDKYNKYLNGTLFGDINNDNRNNTSKDINKNTNDKVSDKDTNKTTDNKENNKKETNKKENNQ